jgi:hypothetical protein
MEKHDHSRETKSQCKFAILRPEILTMRQCYISPLNTAKTREKIRQRIKILNFISQPFERSPK